MRWDAVCRPAHVDHNCYSASHRRCFAPEEPKRSPASAGVYPELDEVGEPYTVPLDPYTYPLQPRNPVPFNIDLKARYPALLA